MSISNVDGITFKKYIYEDRGGWSYYAQWTRLQGPQCWFVSLGQVFASLPTYQGALCLTTDIASLPSKTDIASLPSIQRRFADETFDSSVACSPVSKKDTSAETSQNQQDCWSRTKVRILSYWQMCLTALDFCKMRKSQSGKSLVFMSLWSRKPDGHWRVKLPSESENNWVVQNFCLAAISFHILQCIDILM